MCLDGARLFLESFHHLVGGFKDVYVMYVCVVLSGGSISQQINSLHMLQLHGE